MTKPNKNILKATFTMDKDDVGGGIRVKGDRSTEQFYGSLYLPTPENGETQFTVTVEVVAKSE